MPSLPPRPQDTILYQNPAKTVTLLDLPRSISFAQGTLLHPCNAQIISTPAIEQPYPSTEPKSEIAKANVLRMTLESDASAEFPEDLLLQALREIAENLVNGTWCLDRKVSPSVGTKQNKKRKHGNEGKSFSQATVAEPTSQAALLEPESILARAEKLEELSCGFHNFVDLSVNIGPHNAPCPSVRHTVNKLCHNPTSRPLSLEFAQAASDVSEIYKIPPDTRFILSKINQDTAPTFSMAAVTAYPDSSATAGRGQFDFILLDPPWENRSVRRSTKYDTMRTTEPMDVLQSMLGQHITPGGLVACWITNKARARQAAMEAFETWDVQLIEEWAWLKITANGEPVTAINGIWRKPYEILLLGRRHEHGVKWHRDRIGKRVIAAVPDIHSKKPNLKGLVEPMLPTPYRSLEIFARNMTAGWWAWGDEVLKFAWDGYWSNEDEILQESK